METATAKERTTDDVYNDVYDDVYMAKERVRVIQEVREDYLIEDLETETRYLIDKALFMRKYEREADHLPVHTELWAKLENLGYQLFQLRRANTRLRNELKRERRMSAELRKQGKEKQHYRNGQKRGRTRNG